MRISWTASAWGIRNFRYGIETELDLNPADPGKKERSSPGGEYNTERRTKRQNWKIQ